MIPRNRAASSSSCLRLSADPYRGAELPTPADFGLPSKYTTWRAWQYATVERIINDPHRFFVLCAPTGAGKSLTGEAVAAISGLRTVLLTATKGLQDQIIKDFGEIALDIRGMSNFPCIAAPQLGLRADTTVSDAPCQMGYKCPLRFGGGCEYFDRYRRAQSAPNIVTNYQCWMYDGQKEKTAMHVHPDIYNAHMSNDLPWTPADDPRIPVDLLIADECFVAGTLIGQIPIEAVRVGVLVPSWDEGSGTRCWRPVTKVMRRRPSRLCVVRFKEGCDVVCTPNHPFLTRYGWVSPDSAQFLNSTVLQDHRQATPGQEEDQIPYWVGVESVEILESSGDGTFGGLCPDGFVYNLEVEGTHTYTANGYVVHNCDQAVEELSRFVGVEISRRESLHAGILWPDGDMDLAKWQDWATEQKEWLLAHIKTIEARVTRQNEATGGGGWSKELKGLRDVERKLKSVMEMCAEDEWVVDEQYMDASGSRSASAGGRAGGGGGGGGKRHAASVTATSSTSPSAVTFSPLTPARYAERYLWRGVEKVVLMSATVREKTAELLGIDPDEMTFIEYPSSFPVERRPIIFVPSVQMNYRTEQDDAQMMIWLARLDTILGARLDRKGVIHAVSYKRAQFIKDNSEWGRHMLTHNSHNRADVVEQYKNAAAPCILVSPSVDTGYDFAGDLARFQIIAKLPFASTQDKLMKARQERDPNYGMFLVSQVLVQMTGRAVRSAEDYAECFILDNNWLWAFRRMREFLPDWWLQSLVWADGPTKPLALVDVVPGVR